MRKSSRHFFPLLFTVVTLLHFSFASCPLWAEDISTLLPARFAHVTSADEITEDGFYLIGSTYSVISESTVKEGFCLMTSTVTNKSYLKGEESVWPCPSIMDCEKSTLVWQFQKKGDNTFSIHPANNNNNAIYTNKPSGTSLQLGTGTNLTLWILQDIGDGTFSLNCEKATNRQIGLNWLSANDMRFGNYTQSGADAKGLHLYKMVRSAHELPGNATFPTDNSAVTIYGGAFVAGNSREGIDGAPYLLNDGTIAPGEAVAQWTCRHREGNAFVLETSNRNFLGYDMNEATSEVLWNITDGRIATNESPARYLVYVPAEREFQVREKEQTTGTEDAVFLPVGTPPSSMLEQGVKTLFGAWNADLLANLDWTGTYALDMSDISLPRQARAFSNFPEERNIPLYVSKQDVEQYPEAWQFVVSEGRLLTRTVLKDKCDLVLDRSIETTEQAPLVYERELQGDGMWETLCLPFAATLPDQLDGEEFVGINGKEITFQSVGKIAAHRPIIFRPGDTANPETGVIEISSTPGIISPTIKMSGLFFGTYLPIDVENENSRIYLLNSQGDTFVHATRGSHLSPFRAYLQMENPGSSTTTTFVVRHQEISLGIPTEQMAEGRTRIGYGADGRRIDLSSPATRQALPHGVYIINGKKYIR